MTEVDKAVVRIATLLGRAVKGRWERIVAHGAVTSEYGSVRVGRVERDGAPEVDCEVESDLATEIVGAFDDLHEAWLRAGHAAWERAHVWINRDGSVDLEVEESD